MIRISGCSSILKHARRLTKRLSLCQSPRKKRRAKRDTLYPNSSPIGLASPGSMGIGRFCSS
jgi:hypothetical protein